MSTRFIQYVGNKPKKRDTVLRTDREWLRGSVIEVPLQDAMQYLQHRDMFVDVTNELDEDGNPPELAPLKPPKGDKAQRTAEENTAREMKRTIATLEEALEESNARIAELEGEATDADESIAALEKQVGELQTEVTSLTEQLEAAKKDAGTGSTGGTGTTEPTDAAERQKAILGVLEKLDTNTDYDREGKPKVDAISKALGWKVSGAERDAAWQSVLDANKA